MNSHKLCRYTATNSLWTSRVHAPSQHVSFNPEDITNHMLETHKEEDGSPPKVRCPSCKAEVVLEEGAATLTQHYL